MIRPFTSAVNGLQANTKIVNRAANNIANVNTEGSESELPRDMTNLMVGQRGFEANIPTIQTNDEMLRNLLNMKR